jgi:CHAD domain-containing protein
VAFELTAMDGSVEAGVRRLVDEQLETALGELRGAGERGADAAVHAARKRFKRVRAVVRLVRGSIGETNYRHENVFFRDAGARLSEARDAAVLVETLTELKGAVDDGAYAAARKLLLARRRAVNKRVLEEGGGLEAVAQAVEEARTRVATWQLDSDGWDALEPGLKQIYQAGRWAFKRADLGGHPELFHEWRKRVKDLWHHTEVLEEVWPEMMKVLAEEFHELADTLGKEHDLSVLKSVLEAEALARAEGPSAVIEAIDVRRTALGREAKAAGERLFAEKPGAFVKRLGRYWEAWRAAAAPVEARAEPEGAESGGAMPVAEPGPSVAAVGAGAPATVGEAAA